MTSRQGHRPGWAGAWGLLGLAATLELVLAASTPNAGPGGWWSAVGLYVGLLLAVPLRWWAALVPGVLAATSVVLLLVGEPLAVVAVGSVGTAVMAASGAAVLRAGIDHRLGTARDLVRLGAAAGVVGIGGGLTALAVAAASGSTLPTTLSLVAAVVAHAVSVATLTSLVLLVGSGGTVPGPEWLLALQVVVLAAATWAAFGVESAISLTFLPLAALGWAALAFGLPVAVAELVAVVGTAVVVTSRGLGPIGAELADGTLRGDEAGALVQGYALVAVLVTLPLGVVVHQHRAMRERMTVDREVQRRTFEHSPVPTVLLDEHAGALHVYDLNDAAASLLSTPRDRAVGRRLLDLVRVDGRLPVVADGLIGGRPVWRGHGTAAGHPISRVDLMVSTLGARDDGPTYTAQLLDVTQEAAATSRMVTAQQLTETTLDTAGCVILVTDPHGMVMRVNAATRDITGYAPDRLVGRLVWDTPVSPAGRSELEALLMWPNRSGLPVVQEGTVTALDGRQLRLIWNSAVVLSDSGQPAYCVITGVDVTVERSSTGLVRHLMQASITTALIGTDTSGRITVFNSGAEFLLGCTAAEAVGRPLPDFLDADEVRRRGGPTFGRQSDDATPAFLAFVERLADGSESPNLDWTWITTHGLRRVVSMTLSPVHDGSTRLGYLCIGQDVTERREGHRALSEALDRERAAVDRLQALDRARDEFVSTVSHELRTPITSILGFTELLQDGATAPPDPAQLPLLGNIVRASHRLMAICNDLLLLSGLDAGGVTLAMGRQDLTECADGAVEAVRPLLVGRDLRVEVERPLQPVVVNGDRAQLERAVVNLLSNAVKFTDDGGVITLRVDADATDAMLTVTDTGMGIDPADQEAIFDRFFRTDEAQRQAVPGTGLGLSIVADIVQVHGGRVEVASVPGTGTTFTLRIGLARDAEDGPGHAGGREVSAELG